MSNIVRLNQLPEGSGSLTSDDIFVFMDDPSGSGITKKISLSQISAAIGGGGGGGNPFDQDLNTTNSPSFRALNLIDQSVTLNNLTFIGNNGEDGYSGLDLFFTTEDLKGISAGWTADTVNGLQQVVDVYAHVHEGNNGYVIALPGSGSIGYPILESPSATFYNNVSSGINFPNSTSIRIGSYNNGTGGNNGISLNCAVGYELNWQGGHLRSSYNNGNNTSNIIFDSPLQFSDDSVQNTAYSPYTDIYELNSVSGDVYIDWAPSKQIQKLSLNGTPANFLLGTGWPTTNQSVDTVLEITVTNTTSITWAIADSWYNGDPITSLSPGKHQFLLRSMGPTLNISSSHPSYSYNALSKQWTVNNHYIQSSSTEDDGINMNIYYIGSSS